MNLLLGLLLFSLLGCASALSCTAQWECSSVTFDYNFVSCNNNLCQCRATQGFVGSATTESPCACDKTVYWEGGLPYCLSLAESAALKNTISKLDTMGSITPKLNWTAAGSYTIRGTFKYNIQPSTNVLTFPATLAINVETRSIYFNHVSNIHFLFPDSSQSLNGIPFSSIFFANRCYISNYTSVDQFQYAAEASYVGEVINSKSLKVKRYIGDVFDHHVAPDALAGNNGGRLASYTEQTDNGVILHWSWDHLFTLFGNQMHVLQTVDFDPSTLVYGTPDAALFTLPTACSTHAYNMNEISKPAGSQVPYF